MAQDIHYNPKTQGKENHEEILYQSPKQDQKQAGKTSNSTSPCLILRDSSGLQHLFWFQHTFGLVPIPLISFPKQVISLLWHFQCLRIIKETQYSTSQFHAVFSRSPLKDTPSICLASVTIVIPASSPHLWRLLPCAPQSLTSPQGAH